MKDHDPRACAGTALVTLLAIAGFVCIVALPAADSHARRPSFDARIEARAGAEPIAPPCPGELQ